MSRKSQSKAKKEARPVTLPKTWELPTLPLLIDGGHGVTYQLSIDNPAGPSPAISIDNVNQTCHVRATSDVLELFRRIEQAADEVLKQGKAVAAWNYRRDLACELESMAKLVDVATPTNSPVRRAFQNAGLLGEGIDDFEASDERYENARQAFYALRPEQQREILNGWSPQPERLTAADLMHPCDDDEVRRALTIAIRDSDVSCHHQFLTQVGSSHTPVCVVIQEGTSKADAIRHMEEAVRMIRDAWAVLVDESRGRFGRASQVAMAARDRRLDDEAFGMTKAGTPKALSDLLPARVMFDGNTPHEAAFRANTSAHNGNGGTQITTAETVDRNGVPIRVGDTVVESDGSVLRARGEDGACRVVAVAGNAIIYQRGKSGKHFNTTTADACFVVSGNEKGGASQTPNATKPASHGSDGAKAATPAAA